jgi:hypothetical protein
MINSVTISALTPNVKATRPKNNGIKVSIIMVRINVGIKMIPNSIGILNAHSPFHL